MKYTKKNMFFFLNLILLAVPLIPSDFNEYNDDLDKKTPLNSLIGDVKNNFFSDLGKKDFDDKNENAESEELKKNKPVLTAYDAILAEGQEQDNPKDNETNQLSEGHASVFFNIFGLGVKFNPHITFIMLSVGVVLALLFPQKTKSLLRETKSKIILFFANIKDKLSRQEKTTVFDEKKIT